MQSKINISLILSAVLLTVLCTMLASCRHSERETKEAQLVIGIYPHDKNSQTQGLILHNGFIYEGTGPCKNGPSSLRKIELSTGNILQYISLPKPVFGEGITVFDNRIIQLTYLTKTGYVYDLETFKQIRTFSYETEGWGLTNDGKHLIMSDGTSTLQFLDPETFEVVKRVQVHDRNGEIRAINELEYINGFIYANIFLTEIIKKIDPETGMVAGSFNLKTILGRHYKFG
ncbi:MAG: glutaminyl-peptide cyclotransferase, partial [Deltaproteobacteria bacterium]|nr:glutaminyl-peptide cyclotransferase [Deltaproteobacteria bacterium]